METFVVKLGQNVIDDGCVGGFITEVCKDSWYLLINWNVAQATFTGQYITLGVCLPWLEECTM
jgi:hypothetical protein